MKYYKIEIDETAKNSPKEEESQTYNTIIKKFNSIDEIKEYLKERYGKDLLKDVKKRGKIYIDDKNGNAIPIGFLYSFWNRDISHNSKSWYQTDWIIITKVNEENINIENLNQKEV